MSKSKSKTALCHMSQCTVAMLHRNTHISKWHMHAQIRALHLKHTNNSPLWDGFFHACLKGSLWALCVGQGDPVRVHPTQGRGEFEGGGVKKSGRNGGGGGGGRREAGFGGFPTPARALGSRGGKYLPLRGWVGSCRRHRLPVIGLEMVELIKLEADVLNGELQQVPETSQVLGCGSWIGIRILTKRWMKINEWQRCEDRNNSDETY